jgi:hypothetical protein
MNECRVCIFYWEDLKYCEETDTFLPKKCKHFVQKEEETDLEKLEIDRKIYN